MRKAPFLGASSVIIVQKHNLTEMQKILSGFPSVALTEPADEPTALLVVADVTPGLTDADCIGLRSRSTNGSALCVTMGRNRDLS